MTDTASHGVHSKDAATTEIEMTPRETAETPGLEEGSLRVWSTESPTSAIKTGIWACSPGSFAATRDGWSESFYVLEGRATISGDDGIDFEVGVGDVLVLPDGWTGRWDVHEQMRKAYTRIEHADA